MIKTIERNGHTLSIAVGTSEEFEYHSEEYYDSVQGFWLVHYEDVNIEAIFETLEENGEHLIIEEISKNNPYYEFDIIYITDRNTFCLIGQY